MHVIMSADIEASPKRVRESLVEPEPCKQWFTDRTAGTTGAEVRLRLDARGR